MRVPLSGGLFWRYLRLRLAHGSSEANGEGSTSREAVAAIRQARELGGQSLDTAQGYGFGASEQPWAGLSVDDLDNSPRRGRDRHQGWAADDRATVSFATRAPTFFALGLEDSLRRARGFDHIDIYQAHWPDPRRPHSPRPPPARPGSSREGKVRHAGVSNYDVDPDGRGALGTRPVEERLRAAVPPVPPPS